jgi:hypothetical protein
MVRSVQGEVQRAAREIEHLRRLAADRHQVRLLREDAPCARVVRGDPADGFVQLHERARLRLLP